MENSEIKKTDASTTVEQVSIEELKKKYKKHNPFIFGDKNLASKKFKNAYISIKLSIVFLIAVFGMVGLWFTTQWQSNTIANLGLDLKTSSLSYVVATKNLDIEGVWNGTYTLESKALFDGLIGKTGEMAKQYKAMSELGLWQFATAKPEYKMMIEAIIGLAFVGIIFVIPSLTFKNGTAYSVGSLSVVFICLVAIITMFSILMNYEMELVNTFKGTTYTFDFGEFKIGDNDITEEQLTSIKTLIDKQNSEALVKATETWAKYLKFVLGVTA